jgi:glucose-1-phosphate thymidylyltransferase
MVRLDSQGRVLEINDKPARTDLTLMWGCIIWKPRFTEYLHERVERHGVADFAKIVNSAIGDGFCIRGVPVQEGSYSDLGTYDEILALDESFRQR